MLNKILVPTDGTTFSDEAIDYAVQVSKVCDCKIVLLNVIDDLQSEYTIRPYTYSRELVEKMHQEHVAMSDSILAEAKKKVEDLGDRVSVVQKQGVPYDEIIKYAEENDIDLIVIGSKGTRGLRNMLGSVARKVATKSEKPVLIVR